jgi:hypothetical protein
MPPGMQLMKMSPAGALVNSLEMEGDRFTEPQIKFFKENPNKYKDFVRATEEVVNSRFGSVSIASTNSHGRALEI